MINRWQGNTGRVQRLPEKEAPKTGPPPPRPQPPSPPQPGHRPRPKSTALPPLFSPPEKKKGGLLSGLESLK